MTNEEKARIIAKREARQREKIENQQAEKSQAQLLNSTSKRRKGSVSLKGGKNVRSKVSQNSSMKQQNLKNNFTDREE